MVTLSNLRNRAAPAGTASASPIRTRAQTRAAGGASPSAAAHEPAGAPGKRKRSATASTLTSLSSAPSSPGGADSPRKDKRPRLGKLPDRRRSSLGDIELPEIHVQIASGLSGGEMLALRAALQPSRPQIADVYAQEQRIRVETEKRAAGFHDGSFQLAPFAVEVRLASTALGPDGDWSGRPLPREAAAAVICLAPEIRRSAGAREEFSAALDITMLLPADLRKEALRALVSAAGDWEQSRPRRGFGAVAWSRLAQAVEANFPNPDDRTSLTVQLLKALPKLSIEARRGAEEALPDKIRDHWPRTVNGVQALSDVDLRSRVRAGLALLMADIRDPLPHEAAPLLENADWQHEFEETVAYAADRVLSELRRNAARMRALAPEPQVAELLSIVARAITSAGASLAGEAMFVHGLESLLEPTGTASLPSRTKALEGVPGAIGASSWPDRRRVVGMLHSVVRVGATLPGQDRVDFHDRLCTVLCGHARRRVREGALQALSEAAPAMAAGMDPSHQRALAKSLDVGKALKEIADGRVENLFNEALFEGSDEEKLPRLDILLAAAAHAPHADIFRRVSDALAGRPAPLGFFDHLIGLFVRHLPAIVPQPEEEVPGWHEALVLAQADPHAPVLLPGMAARARGLPPAMRFDALRMLLWPGYAAQSQEPLVGELVQQSVAAERACLSEAERGRLTQQLLDLAALAPQAASGNALLDALDSTPEAEEAIRRMRLDPAGRDAARQQLLDHALAAQDDNTRLERLGVLLRSVGRIDSGEWDIETCRRVCDAVGQLEPGPTVALVTGMARLMVSRLDRLDGPDGGERQRTGWQHLARLASDRRLDEAARTALAACLQAMAGDRPAIGHAILQPPSS